VTPACSSCGAELTPDARFCASCGAAADASSSREARKVVTALFADVVGSTPLAERLDPEDFKSIVGEAVSRMVLAVQEFGGDVSEFAGDGILALFGAPTAHEDDPERAVLAGLRIAERARELAAEVAQEWSIEDFAVRVGIETGLAVLGPVGAGARVEYGAVGDALNTAARLQAASQPGVVLVGATTRRSIEKLFDWGDPRELTLKGKADPVTAYPVLGARAKAEGEMPGAASPIVGREPELELAGAAVDRVLDGSGGILVVSGDAGIGKSRLVAELRRRFEAGGPGPRWLEGRCVSYGEGLPYWPFRVLVGDLLDQAPAEHVPFLEVVLGVAEPDVVAPGMTEETPRLVGDAVAATLAGLAGTGPVALALDDLHWADASSLALVERLFELVEEEQVLLILTARTEREHPFWRLREKALREVPHRASEVALESLAEEAGRGLLTTLVGSAALPAELERRLLGRAEGNPFYLEELVGSLVDAGALVRSNGDWHFDREIPVDVPETVEKVILTRIDRLGSEAHELLSVASVLGRQFPVSLLEEVSESGEHSRDALRELQRADLIRDGGRRPVPMLTFKHSLIQEATYRSLLKRRRQELHKLAVQAIETLYAERIDEFLGMLAHHTSAAGEDRLAFQYHRRAGEAARRLRAVDEAIEQYTGALAAGARLGLDSSVQEMRDSILQRSRLQFDTGEVATARLGLERVAEAARSAGDGVMQVEALLSLVSVERTIDFSRATAMLDEAVRLSETVEAATRVGAFSRLSIQYSNQLQLDRAVEIGERALALTEAGSLGVAALVPALDALKLTALQLGDLHRLEVLVTRLLDLIAESAEAAFYEPWARLEAAFVPLGAGRLDEAEGQLKSVLEFVRRKGGRMHEPLFLDALCWTYRSSGDFERAVAAGRQAADSGRETGNREWLAWASATLGWAHLDAEEPEAAAETLEEGMRAARDSNAPAQTTRCTCLLALARSKLGESAAAVELATRGEELLDRVSTPPGRAWLFGAHAYFAVAEVWLDAGEPARAEALVAPVVAAAAESDWLEPKDRGAALLRRVREA
jgi:class 3 adenylate cyclase